jgi:hypothetical protein
MQVTLKEVRLAFPKLWEAKAVGNGDSKYYSAAFPIDPKSENHKALTAAIEAVAKEKWGAKAAGILSTIREKGDIGYKLKPLKSAEGDVYDGFQDMYSLNASRREDKGRVLVVDRVKQPLTEQDGKPYAGCYVNAVIEVWAQDNSNGKRVNAELKAVQFVKDGDAFGSGAPVSADAFEDLGVEQEESLA